MSTIQNDKFYKVSEVIKAYPILQTRNRVWLYTQIKNGRLKATNIGPKDGVNYFVVKGSDAKKFVASFK